MTVPIKGGRPLKFSSVEELQQKIDGYFKSCWEEVWHQESIKDDKGKNTGEYIWIQDFDREGNPLMRQVKPYTVTGLAVCLNTSRETLDDYAIKPEFSDCIKRAKDICENYLDEASLQGKVNPIRGIFGLKQFGWIDKIEVNTTTSSDQLTNDDIQGKINELKKKQNKAESTDT
jgi:hypothetical protein